MIKRFNIFNLHASQSSTCNTSVYLWIVVHEIYRKDKELKYNFAVERMYLLLFTNKDTKLKYS